MGAGQRGSAFGGPASNDPAAVATTINEISPGNPTGFVDRTETTLSWSDTTPDRTLTVTPTGTQYTYYIDSTKHVVDVASTVQLPDDATGTLALLNDCVDQYEAHRILTAGGQHTTADSINAVSATSPATSEAEAVALANDLKAVYNLHIADLLEGNPHLAADATNTVAAADATELATLQTLLNELKVDVNGHDGTGGPFHDAAGSNTVTAADATDTATILAAVNDVYDQYEAHRVFIIGGVHLLADATNTVAAADATDQASVETLLNELKIDVNAHDSTGGPFHLAGSANTVTEADATDETTAVALANDLKVQYTAHIADLTGHFIADATNAITAPDATDTASAVTLANDIKAQYELHRVDLTGRAHGVADATNVVAATYPATSEAEAFALANDIKAKYNAHRVLVGGGEHLGVDGTNIVSTADASDWATTITLVDELQVDFDAHRVLTAGPVHGSADATNAIVEPANAGPATSIALANDLKTQYEAHRVDRTPHVDFADSGNDITAADATNLATAITLANEIKLDYEAHRQEVGTAVHGAADATNTIVSADATDYESVVTLVNEFKNTTGYTAHAALTAGGVHGAADVTNVITVDDAETAISGVWYIYFDSAGTLTASQTKWEILDADKAFVSIVLWDDLNRVGLWGDERHTTGISVSDHDWKHHAAGTVVGDGLAMSGYTLATDSDAGVTVGFSTGEAFDEDIDINPTDDATPTLLWEQDLTDPGKYPCIYRSGARGIATGVAAAELYMQTAGTGRVAWNEWTGSTWQLTEATDGYHVNYWFAISNQYLNPIIVIPGQTEYAMQASAEAEAWGDLDLGAAIFAEAHPLYRVTFKTKNTYAGTTKSRIAVVTDFRKVSTVPGAGASTSLHGGLPDLATSGHPADIVAVDASAFAGNLSATDTDVQTALDTLDGMTAGGGKVLGHGIYVLGSDKSTTSSSNPPTVVMHSGSYTKLSATSYLVVSHRSAVYKSSTGIMYFGIYHGSTDVSVMGDGTAANQTGTVTDSAKITGLGTGAVTVGVKHSVSTGTTYCDPSSGARRSVLEVWEIEV